MTISYRFLLALFVTTLVAPMALAGAKITIKNNDAASEGFNDPTAAAPVGGNSGTTIGQQRLIAFERAAEIWAETLDSDVEIEIEARFDPLECSATSAVLGSAGPLWADADFPGAPAAETWYVGALSNRLSGEDRDPDTLEIRARFNSELGKSSCLGGRNWYYGLDNNHGTDLDLLVVLLHEFGHGLGFLDLVDNDTGALFADGIDAYASFLFDNGTNKRWSAMTNAERLTSMENTGKVVLDGPQTTAGASAFLSGVGITRVNVSAPPSIAKTYTASRGTVGGAIGNGVSGTFALASDPSDSDGTSTTDGCSPLTNAAAVAGKIVLVDRGTCTFKLKAKHAQDAGALAVIVINNDDSSALPGLGGGDASSTIPVVGITKADGATIRAQLESGVTGTIDRDLSSGYRGADASGHPLVFAPSPFEPGSSIAHYDDTATPNVLMEHAVSADLGSRVDLTEALFRDIGWFSASTMTLTMRDSIAIDADADGQADPGDTIRYALTVANAAGAGATGVVLTNTPDSATSLVTGSVQTPNGTVTKGNGAGDASIEIALTGLKPGASATAQFDVVVKSEIASGTSSVSTQSTLDGSNFDPIPSDDPDTGAAGDATSTLLDLNPMKVDKVITSTIDADSSGGVTAGDTIVYSISIRNAGTTTVTDAVLSDTPDTNTTLVTGSVTTTLGTIASGNQQGATSVTVNLGAIAPGATAGVALSVKVDADIPSRIVLLSNQASLASTNVSTVVSNDPRNSVPNDATSVNLQPVRIHPLRR